MRRRRERGPGTESGKWFQRHAINHHRYVGSWPADAYHAVLSRGRFAPGGRGNSLCIELTMILREGEKSHARDCKNQRTGKDQKLQPGATESLQSLFACETPRMQEPTLPCTRGYVHGNTR